MRRQLRNAVCLPAAYVLLLFFILSCGDGEGPAGPSGQPASISITPAAVEMSAIGDSVQLTGEARDASGRTLRRATVAWSSSAPAVVTVSASGLAVAVANGEAAITATSGRASATAPVVVAQSIASVAVTPARLAFAALGDTARLAATAQDARGHAIEGADVTWSSDDPAVATVDAAGLVTAAAAGGAEITATGLDALGEAIESSTPVTVGVASAVTVAPGSLTLEVIGDTASIRATVLDDAGNLFPDAPVAWSSDDPAVAAVDPDGVITALRRGRTVIRAESGAANDQVSVHVTPRSLHLSPDRVSLPWPLLTKQLAADVRDDETGESLGPPDSVRWVSRDTMIATVSPAGIVTAIRKGTARIAATAGRKAAEVLVEVADPDRDALVAFYHATGGDDWANNDNWLSDRPIWQPPGWYGVMPGSFVAGAEGDRTARLEAMLDTLGAPNSNSVEALAAQLGADWQAWSTSAPEAWTDPRQEGAGTVASPFAGRVAGLHLSHNNLTGVLPDAELWEELPFLDNLVLVGNSLAGELPSSFGNVAVLNVSKNELGGEIPPALFDDPLLLVIGFDGNRLTGAVPDGLLRRTALMSLNGNELTGRLTRLPEIAPRLFWVSWADNDGLCHELTDGLRAVVNSGSFFVGPVCDQPPAEASSMVLDPSYVEFAALGDSIEIEVRAVDDWGWRVSVPPLAWTNTDEEVAAVTQTATGKYWLKAGADGETEIAASSVSLPRDKFQAFRVPLGVRVRQVAVLLDIQQQITIPAGGSAEWAAVPRDRNGNAMPLPRGAITRSSDAAVATVYRNNVLWAAGEGRAFVSTTLPGGLYNAAIVDVAAAPERPIPVIDDLSAAPLVPGSPVTIGGRNLGRHVTVLIDGERAEMLDATPTAVTVSVPTFGGCTPPRDVAVVVKDGEDLGDATITHLAGVGEDLSAIARATLRGPLPVTPAGELCLQSAMEDGEEYLLGVQALLTSELPPEYKSTLTPVDPLAADFVVGVTGRADDGAAANRVPRVRPLAPAAPAAAVAPTQPESADWLTGHREAERRLRARERETLGRLAGRPRLAAAGAAGTPAIHAATAAGDTVLMIYNNGACESTVDLNGVVKVVNDQVVIVSDLANAADYSDARYAELGAISRALILPNLIRYFGPFTDANDDGRITMVFTDKVTRTARGLLGWVSPINLLSRSDCPGSNEMEVFFGVTPDDPNGPPVQGLELTPDFLWEILPQLIAHETTHLIQGRRFVAQREIVDLGLEFWFAEAQAVLAEEIISHAATGNSQGNNYTADVAFSPVNSHGIRWYWGIFGDLESYFSGAGAPASCGWWTRNSGGCGGRPLWYGVGWSFLRWMLDQYGPTFPGGEAGWNTAMIDAPPEGDEFGKFESLLGEDFGVLLAGWGASLYLDDRVPATDPVQRFQMTSWNLRDIFRHRNIDISTRSLGFADEEAAGDRLRVGSTMFYRLTGRPGASPAAAFHVRGSLLEDTIDSDTRPWYRLQTFIVPMGSRGSRGSQGSPGSRGSR